MGLAAPSHSVGQPIRLRSGQVPPYDLNNYDVYLHNLPVKSCTSEFSGFSGPIILLYAEMAAFYFDQELRLTGVFDEGTL